MATAGTLTYLISIDSSKLSKGLTNAESKVKGFGNKLNAMSVAAGMMITKVATAAARSTAKFVSDSINESMNFDKAMSQVAATLGKSTDQVKELSDFARKMGAETAFTATEAAQALNYMALAGYDTEKSMRMLPTVLNLAAAGNIDLANASDMVTDAQSALGLSIEQTEVLVDQMAKASSKTNTSVQQLGDAILTVGGTAKMMKGGTAELTEVLGVLADNGIKGSEGGTALRNVLLALSAPTNTAAKKIKELGLQVFDAEGNMRDLPSIMDDLNEAMKDMTQEQRTDVINTIFNKRDLKSVEALLGTSKQRWKELAKEIGNASGAAEQMAETQLDNLAGDVTKFNSALGETKLAIIEGLTPTLRRFVKTGTALVQRLTDAFKKKGLKGVLEDIKTIYKGIVNDMKGSSNPLYQALGKLSSVFANGLSWDSIKESVEGAWETIKLGVQGLGKIIFGENVDGTIKWPTWDDVKDAAETAWKAITDGVANLGGLIFGNNTDGSVKWPTWEDVKASAETAWTLISDGLGSIAQWVLGTPEMPSANEVGQAINQWWNTNVVPFINGLLSFVFGIPTPEDESGEATQSLIEKWWNSIVVPLLEGVLDFTLGLFGLPPFKEMVAKIKAWWEDVKKGVGQLIINAVINLTGQTPKEAFDLEDGKNWGDSVVDSYDKWGMPRVDPSTVESLWDDSTAKGNWTVPYDDYIARLHRNEMVLTASQARRYRDGEGNGIGADDIGVAVATAVNQAMSKVLVMMSGEKVGDLTTKRVKRNINANSYSKLRAYGG